VVRVRRDVVGTDADAGHGGDGGEVERLLDLERTVLPRLGLAVLGLRLQQQIREQKQHLSHNQKNINIINLINNK
jgi:hypothetical protein